MPKLTDAFPRKVLPVVENGVIDLLRVADLQRRRAFPIKNRDLVDSICTLTNNLGAALTWINSDYEVRNPVNQPALNEIARNLRYIAADAKALGASEVILPLPYRTMWSKVMRDLIKRDHVEMIFSAMAKPYNLDLSAYGQIDQGMTKNPLYKDPKSMTSIRALWHIEDSAKDRWDNEPKVKRPQNLRLELV